MDLWTSPTDRREPCGPCGQPVDNADALPTACPHSRASRPQAPQDQPPVILRGQHRTTLRRGCLHRPFRTTSASHSNRSQHRPRPGSPPILQAHFRMGLDSTGNANDGHRRALSDSRPRPEGSPSRRHTCALQPRSGGPSPRACARRRCRRTRTGSRSACREASRCEGGHRRIRRLSSICITLRRKLTCKTDDSRRRWCRRC